VKTLRLFLSAAVPAVIAMFLAAADMARAASCTLSSVSTPFSAWGDPASYELFAGGDFEHATWTFAGGAQRVAGSEPFAVTGKLGKWSLSLPPGASARSPSACVAATEPTLRFFIAGSGIVGVKFIYGGTVIPSGEVVAGGTWLPSPVVVTGSAITLTGGTAKVAVKLTGVSGHPQVDDVFIDPWNRG
jgi:hypothetical protein